VYLHHLFLENLVFPEYLAILEYQILGDLENLEIL
jgi:hypothetical protein